MNGFTVNDGPLKDYNSTESVQFMKEMDKGRLPKSLAAANAGGFQIFLKDKYTETFPEHTRKSTLHSAVPASKVGGAFSRGGSALRIPVSPTKHQSININNAQDNSFEELENFVNFVNSSVVK
jgi:hypothetical protein